MDPNEALRQMRRITRGVAVEDIGYEEAVDSLNELIECVEGLDGWLSKGGFLPDAWVIGSSAAAAEAGSSTIDLINAAAHELRPQRSMAPSPQRWVGDTAAGSGVCDGLEI